MDCIGSLVFYNPKNSDCFGFLYFTIQRICIVKFSLLYNPKNWIVLFLCRFYYPKNLECINFLYFTIQIFWTILVLCLFYNPTELDCIILFYNPKNLDCIVSLSFLKSKECGMFLCAVFLQSKDCTDSGLY